MRDILRKLSIHPPEYCPRMYVVIIHSTEDDMLWPRASFSKADDILGNSLC